MKKHQLLAVLCTGLVLSSISFVSNASAQIKGKRGASKQESSSSSKKAPRPSKISSLQTILRERNTGGLAPSAPCTTSVAITVGQPIDGGLATGDCVLDDGTLIDFYNFKGTAGQAIWISMNSAAFDTYLYLLDDAGKVIDENDDSGSGSNSRIPEGGGIMTLPYTGDYLIGANSFSPTTGAYTVSLNTDAVCSPALIFYNQTVSGVLATPDCAINISAQPYYTDLYTFYGVAGKQISITMASAAVDSYLVLHTPSGTGSLADDDSGGGSDARIPASGTFTLPETGTYTIEASTFNTAAVGNYTLNVVGPATGSISGRIVTPAGAGLRNATVSITIAGVAVRVTTSAFGFYTFNNVPTNATYVITVPSRLFRFSPRTVIFNDDLTNVDFTGLE